MKRWTAFFMCMVLVLMTVGCGGNQGEGAGADTSVPVELRWLIAGSNELEDEQLVFDEFNKRLAEYLPNTTVKFETIPFTDYGEKWKLLAASRENYDLVWSGWMLDYPAEVERGSYVELDGLLEQYGQDIKAELPQWLLDRNRIDGKLYSIPNYQMSGIINGIFVKKDVAEKYLDIEAVEKFVAKEKGYTVEDYKIFEDFLSKAKANGEMGKGVAYSFYEEMMRCQIGNPGGEIEWMKGGSKCFVNFGDESRTVYDICLDLPEAEKYYEITNDWYNKGYMRKDILSVQDKKEDIGKANGNILWSGQCFEGAAEQFKEQYGFEVLVFPERCAYIDSSVSSTNTAIAATSKNPERAMMLLNLMNSKKGKDLYNLLVYGIEGVHYNKVSDTRIEWLGEEAPGSNTGNKYGYQTWVLGNTFNAYETQFDIEGWNDYILNDVNANAEKSVLMGFTLDTKPIQLELSQYASIMKEYEYLETGAAADYKKLLKERNDKLKAAGGEKIKDEIQKQINEWVKNVNP